MMLKVWPPRTPGLLLCACGVDRIDDGGIRGHIPDNDLENWGRPQFLVIHAAVILGPQFLVSRIFELSLDNLDGFHTRKPLTELDLAEKGPVLLNSEGFSAIN